MDRHHHPPPLAATEEAVIAPFCLVHDAYMPAPTRADDATSR